MACWVHWGTPSGASTVVRAIVIAAASPGYHRLRTLNPSPKMPNPSTGAHQFGACNARIVWIQVFIQTSACQHKMFFGVSRVFRVISDLRFCMLHRRLTVTEEFLVRKRSFGYVMASGIVYIFVASCFLTRYPCWQLCTINYVVSNGLFLGCVTGLACEQGKEA